MLELRGLPGPAHAGALSQRERKNRVRPYPERVGSRGRPHAGRDPRELPECRRVGECSRRVARVHERGGEAHAGLIKFAPSSAAERWQSGRMRQTRNLLYPSGTGGSNPSLSAKLIQIARGLSGSLTDDDVNDARKVASGRYADSGTPGVHQLRVYAQTGGERL